MDPLFPSNPAAVMSGVPQGTMLGPLLFLLYINDMPAKLNSLLKLFADDSYLYRHIKSILDMHCLQNDLDKLQDWDQNWDIEFHPKKWKLLSITNKTKPIPTEYKIYGETLESVETIKYLGLTLYKNLNGINMYQSPVQTHQRRYFLQRILRGCSKKTKIQAYRTYVLPMIMYVSVWNPIGSKNVGL